MWLSTYNRQVIENLKKGYWSSEFNLCGKYEKKLHNSYINVADWKEIKWTNENVKVAGVGLLESLVEWPKSGWGFLIEKAHI